ITTPVIHKTSSNNEPNDNHDNCWKIIFIPEPQILLSGNEPVRIFRELASLGELTTEANTSNIPELNDIIVDECHISWTLWLNSTASKDDIIEIFDWVLDECKLEITHTSESIEANTNDSEPTAQEITAQESTTSNISTITPPLEKAENIATPKEVASNNEVTTQQAAAPASSSIRVGIDKVDNLINLVGELVITQSMLSELGNNFEMEKLERLSTGLEQLLQNTKELQESVMRIRMLPISFAFNRFPRMIRDLSTKTGKKVELKLTGEQTELDKTVMEQINDPLVHLVRNAIDHGIEPSEERLALGKPETGEIHLNAYHKGGSIVIEISDDGRGLDPDKLVAKAVEKGIIGAHENLTEEQIYDLIFAAGFSTAAVVSDISGRGVGMDVVKRNIKDLGGRIEIESTLGKGSLFRVHLPLTLAILDGQLVQVGSETYIIPLVSIVESLQIKSELVNNVSGSMILYRLREDNVPIIPLYQEFNIEAEHTDLTDSLLVVVEDSGQKVGLLVDDLLAQQQVVIKSLDSNYQRVEGISGATILGDGSVSLILDIPGLIQYVMRRARNQAA
ncbi:chemotaxis protein CheA, partial [bacterium]|nr:chemotaxis protein CheA [bacterium]